MDKSSVLDNIRKKVDRLISDNKRLRQENNKVSVQRDRLKEENRNLSSKVAELEKRISVLELRDGFSGHGDSRIAKARVNRLMREVDKCIALLNR